MMNVLRVLVPMDFSDESALALDWAALVARKQRGATVYLLHVLPLRKSASALSFGSVGYEMQTEEAEQRLKEAQATLPVELLSQTLLEKGEIPDVVARVCDEKDIDLVVMTTRGRRGLKHFLPDSLTEKTIRLTPCPVLVLHHNVKTQALETETMKGTPG